MEVDILELELRNKIEIKVFLLIFSEKMFIKITNTIYCNI